MSKVTAERIPTQLTQNAPGAGLASALNGHAFLPVMRNTNDRITFGAKYHATLSAQAKPCQSHEVERDVQWHEKPKEYARHVLDKDPHQVAMPMVNLRVTVPSDKCRSYVLDGCLGDVQRPIPRKSKPKAKVYILDIEEKLLIQQANRLQCT